MNDLHSIAVPTPFPVGPVNVYLLGGPAPTLVDAGPNTDEALAALREGLAAHGYSLADIRHLVITHAHSDHCGLAARIMAESGGRLYSLRHNLALLADDQAEAGQRSAYYTQVIQQAGLPLSFLVRRFWVSFCYEIPCPEER